MRTDTLTRSSLTKKITSGNNVTHQQAFEILEKTLEEIGKALTSGKSVKIASFGRFALIQKKERVGRNPRTGKDAKISSRRVISFRASPYFKKIVAK